MHKLRNTKTVCKTQFSTAQASPAETQIDRQNSATGVWQRGALVTLIDSNKP